MEQLHPSGYRPPLVQMALLCLEHQKTKALALLDGPHILEDQIHEAIISLREDYV